MKSGYKIFWSDFALLELQATISYLEQNWSERELRNFAHKLEKILILISQNPYLFQVSDKKEIRRVVISSHNTLYYRIANDQIDIISFFSNRQNPKNKKLK